VREVKKRSKKMQERVRGTIAVVVVWVLLGALAAGAALTVNINGSPGDEIAGGGRAVGTLEESLQGLTLAAGGGRIPGTMEE
jgi:hypothetical protein